MMNKHGLPVLPAPAKQRRSELVCRFNHQGNKAMAFIAVQAYRSEKRTKGDAETPPGTRTGVLGGVEERKRREEARAKANGLW